MPILNYTTEISASKTALEVQGILASKGAQRVSVDYDQKGEPMAVEFMVTVNEQPISFRMPCHVARVHSVLYRQKIERRYKSETHARRVAWRIVKDWVEVQMAFIEAGQADMAEAFMPYAIDKDGTTAYQAFLASHQKQLASSNGSS